MSCLDMRLPSLSSTTARMVGLTLLTSPVGATGVMKTLRLEPPPRPPGPPAPGPPAGGGAGAADASGRSHRGYEDSAPRPTTAARVPPAARPPPPSPSTH